MTGGHAHVAFKRSAYDAIRRRIPNRNAVELLNPHTSSRDLLVRVSLNHKIEKSLLSIAGSGTQAPTKVVVPSANDKGQIDVHYSLIPKDKWQAKLLEEQNAIKYQTYGKYFVDHWFHFMDSQRAEQSKGYGYLIHDKDTDIYALVPFAETVDHLLRTVAWCWWLTIPLFIIAAWAWEIREAPLTYEELAVQNWEEYKGLAEELPYWRRMGAKVQS